MKTDTAVSPTAFSPTEGAPTSRTGIRHSSLPKLAACACYEANPDAGPAAARGTLLDEAFRDWMANGEPERSNEWPVEDLEAVRWAVDTLRSLAPGEEILTLDAHCKVHTPGMDHIGTADAIVPALLLSADLKTGQMRNYREQMAAYALGLMETHFADRWTCKLLFCDQKQTVTHEFTYAEALELVEGVLGKATTPERTPELCDYCGWCAKAQTCDARRQSADRALALASEHATATGEVVEVAAFERILESPERLGAFLSCCKVLDDFRAQAEARARELMETGGAVVPGWRLRKGGPIEVVFPDDLARLVAAGSISTGGALHAHGALAAKKFKDLWAREMPGSAAPEECIRQTGLRRASLVQA